MTSRNHSSFDKEVSHSPAASPDRDWWALQERLYRETVERQLRLAERRAERRAQLREDRARAFGDLCEASEGRAVVWRREGVPPERLVAFANLIGDGWLQQTLIRWIRLTATREIDRQRHAERRAAYYGRERERRLALAKERRRITRRTTLNPCPTKEQILAAWLKVRESDADLIRFGSLMEDLECSVDSSLRRDESGEIIGRNGGIKEWLHENIPVLYLRYTTVMRYKAAARKLRQLTGLGDPVPAARIVEGLPRAAAKQQAEAGGKAAARGGDAAQRPGGARGGEAENEITVRTKSNAKVGNGLEGRKEDFEMQKDAQGDGSNGNEKKNCLEGERESQEERDGERREGDADGEDSSLQMRILRAREVYERLTTPSPGSRTAFLARLAAALDPERVGPA